MLELQDQYLLQIQDERSVLIHLLLFAIFHDTWSIIPKILVGEFKSKRLKRLYSCNFILFSRFSPAQERNILQINNNPSPALSKVGQAIEKLKYKLPKDHQDGEMDRVEYPPVFYYRGRIPGQSGVPDKPKRIFPGQFPHFLRWGRTLKI